MLKGAVNMACQGNYCNTRSAGAMNCQMDSCGSSCDSGFSRIVNLIIILVVLQFLTEIICGLSCDF